MVYIDIKDLKILENIVVLNFNFFNLTTIFRCIFPIFINKSDKINHSNISIDIY